MYEVSCNHADRMILIRMGGVMALDEARACAAAKEAAVDNLGPPYVHTSLVDISALRLQTQEIFSVFTNFVATTKHKSRKIAIVAGEGTARMQFRRVAERAPIRGDLSFFTDFDEACHWLKEDQILPGTLYAARANNRPTSR